MLQSTTVPEGVVAAVGNVSDPDPVSFDGAYVPLHLCVRAILNKIARVISTVEGATMEKVLDGAFFLACADGAVHNRLPKGDYNIITYSLSLSSRYLIE